MCIAEVAHWLFTHTYQPFENMDRTVFRLPSSNSTTPLVAETGYDGGIELREDIGYVHSHFRADL